MQLSILQVLDAWTTKDTNLHGYLGGQANQAVVLVRVLGVLIVHHGLQAALNCKANVGKIMG